MKRILIGILILVLMAVILTPTLPSAEAEQVGRTLPPWCRQVGRVVVCKPAPTLQTPIPLMPEPVLPPWCRDTGRGVICKPAPRATRTPVYNWPTN